MKIGNRMLQVFERGHGIHNITIGTVDSDNGEQGADGVVHLRDVTVYYDKNGEIQGEKFTNPDYLHNMDEEGFQKVITMIFEQGFR